MIEHQANVESISRTDMETGAASSFVPNSQTDLGFFVIASEKEIWNPLLRSISLRWNLAHLQHSNPLPLLQSWTNLLGSQISPSSESPLLGDSPVMDQIRYSHPSLLPKSSTTRISRAPPPPISVLNELQIWFPNGSSSNQRLQLDLGADFCSGLLQVQLNPNDPEDLENLR